MGFFAPDPDASSGYFGSVDPSLSPNFAHGSRAAALVARAISPYVNAYEDFAVAPMRAALSAAAPLTDPALWMSLSGIFPPAALPAAVEGFAAKGLHTMLGDVTLVQRASQIHDILRHPAAINGRSVSVLKTNGPTIVGSGVRDIDPIQRMRLWPDEIEARLPREHSEPTVLREAQNRGLTPDSLGNSREICPVCRQLIESLGGLLDSPKTAKFPPAEDLPQGLPGNDEP